MTMDERESLLRISSAARDEIRALAARIATKAQVVAEPKRLVRRYPKTSLFTTFVASALLTRRFAPPRRREANPLDREPTGDAQSDTNSSRSRAASAAPPSFTGRMARYALALSARHGVTRLLRPFFETDQGEPERGTCDPVNEGGDGTPSTQAHADDIQGGSSAAQAGEHGPSPSRT